jgi:hypothetical protein
MRQWVKATLLIGSLGVTLMTTAESALAITCTDRHGVCLAYCDKNYGGSPRCSAVCSQLLSECMSTGCWESRVTARRCGITRQ